MTLVGRCKNTIDGKSGVSTLGTESGSDSSTLSGRFWMDARSDGSGVSTLGDSSTLVTLCKKKTCFFPPRFWHTFFSKPFCSVIFTLYGHKSGGQKQDNIEYLCLLLNLRWQLSLSKSCKRWKLRVTQKGFFAGCCCRESDHIRTFSKH